MNPTELLALTEVESGRFRSSVRHEGFTSLFGATTLYGGQVVALSLGAACRASGEEWTPMSLACSFLRGGRPDEEIDYVVRAVRDGRTTAQRSVDAFQLGRHLSTTSVSFRRGLSGPDSQEVEIPRVEGPSTLPRMPAEHMFGVEIRLPDQPSAGPWPTRYWARGTGPAPAAPAAGACVVAYVSDTCTPLLPTELGHHGPTLSHGLWFHRPIEFGDWFLVDLIRRSTAHGIGQYIGSIFNQSGQLVATLAQEALYRGITPQAAQAPRVAGDGFASQGGKLA